MSGALTAVLIVGLHAVMAMHPPRPRHSTPFSVQFALGWWINEQPILGLYWLLSGMTALLQVRTDSPVWWLAVAIGLADLAMLVQLALRMRFARPALSAALEKTFGPGAGPRYTRPVWWRFVLLPFVSWRPDVGRIANQHYGPGRGRRIDLYVTRRQPKPGAPVLLYLHPGGFRIGSKMLGARPLLYRLAAEGWVVASADYRLLNADYSDQLADTRAALAWLRAHAAAHGGDPNKLFVAGGSAGAHLAATAALTGEPVAGVIGLYGYYGPVGSGPGPRSPEECVAADAPPFLVVHGAMDTLVRREDARGFAERLGAVSDQPVVYAELPGTNHNFDLFHSPRFSAVIDAVQRFVELTLHEASPAEAGLPARRAPGH